MRKRAAGWKEKSNAKKKANKEFKTDLTAEDFKKGDIEIPEDRIQAAIELYDKAWIIAKMMLDDPSNFYTHDGVPKTKQFSDTVASVEKIAKGYAEFAPKKEEATQLLAYSNMLKQLREKERNKDV